MTPERVILAYTVVWQIGDKHTRAFCPILHHCNAGISPWRPGDLLICNTSGRRSNFLQILWSSLICNTPKHLMPSKLCTIAAHLSIIEYFVFIICLLSCMWFVRGYEGLTTVRRQGHAGKRSQLLNEAWRHEQDHYSRLFPCLKNRKHHLLDLNF